MPVQPGVRVCTHIKVSGVRCGSPALRGEQFCYFHQRIIRGVRTPSRPRLHPIAMIEDEESIQVALMEVINHLMCGTIELKRAELIIRALHIAVKNANRVHFGIHSSSMVKDVPDYREPETTNVGTAHVGTGHVGTDAFVRPGGPEVLGRSAVAAARENPAAAMAAHTYPARVETADVKTARVGTGHVGTGAFARPAGPAVSVRSAVPTTKPAAQAASLSHEEFAANLRANRVTASATPQRKPAVSVPASVTQPPKERKNAAHGASRE